MPKSKRRAKKKTKTAIENDKQLEKIQIERPKLFVFEQVESNVDEPWPSARIHHRIVADEQFIYLFGGARMTDSSSTQPNQYFSNIWRFCKGTRIWTVLPTKGEKPTHLLSACLLLLDSQTLLLYGGVCAEGPIEDTVSSKMYICDLNTLIWRQEKYTNAEDDDQLPPKVSGQALVVDEQRRYLYTCGGVYRQKVKSRSFIIDVHRFDLRSKIWVQLGKTDETIAFLGRSGHGMALWDEKLFIFGGNTAFRPQSCTNVPVFNLKSRQWSTVSTLCYHELKSWEKLKVFGRNLENSRYIVKNWTMITNSPESRSILDNAGVHLDENETQPHVLFCNVPPDRTFHSVAQLRSKVYITGGLSSKRIVTDQKESNERFVCNDFWSLDLETLTWTLLGRIPRWTYHSMAISANGELAAFGGYYDVLIYSDMLHTCLVKDQEIQEEPVKTENREVNLKPLPIPASLFQKRISKQVYSSHSSTYSSNSTNEDE